MNCLTNFFPEKALARAKELDEILAKTGKPVGPLHGLPVGVKVSTVDTWSTLCVSVGISWEHM